VLLVKSNELLIEAFGCAKVCLSEFVEGVFKV
jgi:hypothetical protein